jgi:hypothetical protein
MGTGIDFGMIRDFFAFDSARSFNPIYSSTVKYGSSTHGMLRKERIR